MDKAGEKSKKPKETQARRQAVLDRWLRPSGTGKQYRRPEGEAKRA